MNKELSIMEQLCYSTTQIQTEDKNGNVFTGTGFFFMLKQDGGDSRVPLLITNKHVVDGMERGLFRFSEADQNGAPIPGKYLEVNFERDFCKKWIMHPDKDVDLCAFPLLSINKLIQTSGKRIFFRSFDNSMLPSINDIEEFDVAEEILMIGYPNGLWDSANNMPLVRRGITATQYKYDYNGKKEFVIDAACFPGSSGSPIVMCDLGRYRRKSGSFVLGGSRVMLLGILYGGPQLTIGGEIKVVTILNLQQKPLAISRIPNNLGYIIKSNRIMDFMPLFFPPQ